MIFDESKHPRADDGKFTEGKGDADKIRETVKKFSDSPKKDMSAMGVGTENNSVRPFDDISSLLGREYKGYKGQAAVNKLMKEQQGHVKGAFYRDDVGNIDLLWGNDYLGLKHIIKHREEQGINAQQFLSDIAETVESGSFLKRGNNGTFEFWHKGKSVIISPEYHGNKVTYLLTAFKKTLNKSRVPQ